MIFASNSHALPCLVRGLGIIGRKIFHRNYAERNAWLLSKEGKMEGKKGEKEGKKEGKKGEKDEIFSSGIFLERGDDQNLCLYV